VGEATAIETGWCAAAVNVGDTRHGDTGNSIADTWWTGCHWLMGTSGKPAGQQQNEITKTCSNQ
jgi:hypothetical protein